MMTRYDAKGYESGSNVPLIGCVSDATAKHRDRRVRQQQGSRVPGHRVQKSTGSQGGVVGSQGESSVPGSQGESSVCGDRESSSGSLGLRLAGHQGIRVQDACMHSPRPPNPCYRYRRRPRLGVPVSPGLGSLCPRLGSRVSGVPGLAVSPIGGRVSGGRESRDTAGPSGYGIHPPAHQVGISRIPDFRPPGNPSPGEPSACLAPGLSGSPVSPLVDFTGSWYTGSHGYHTRRRHRTPGHQV